MGMGTHGSTTKSAEVKRVAQILAITLILLVIFSVSGLPMILLSTFSPSSIYWDTEEDRFEEFTMDGSSEAA